MEKKFLIANRSQTPDGTILWSRYVHDYVLYQDKNGNEYMLDGGTEYRRYSEPEKAPMLDLSVYSDAPFEEIRQVMLRGTFTKDGGRVWVPLYKINDGHLRGILEYNYNKDLESRFDQFIRREIEYRKEHNISIPEKNYTYDDGIQSIVRIEKS